MKNNLINAETLKSQVKAFLVQLPVIKLIMTLKPVPFWRRK